MPRRTKRRQCNWPHASVSRLLTMITTVVLPLMVVFAPITTTDNLAKTNKRSLSAFLDRNITGGGIEFVWERQWRPHHQRLRRGRSPKEQLRCFAWVHHHV